MKKPIRYPTTALDNKLSEVFVGSNNLPIADMHHHFGLVHEIIADSETAMAAMNKALGI